MRSTFHPARLKILLMVLASIVFFFVYTYLYATAPHVFNSPDEAVNAWMIERVATGEPLTMALPENLAWYDGVGPRAMVAHKEVLLPMGFLGMPFLYGLLHRVMPFFDFFMVLTPFFAVLGAWGVYVLGKRIFNENVGLIAFALYFVIPAMWYYSTRGLFHNMLFTVLWVWSAALLFYGIEQSRLKECLYFLLSALLAAAAVWVRPSEFSWMVVSFVATLVYARVHRSVSRAHGAFFGVVFLAGALSYFVVQYYFLQTPLFGGYSEAYDALTSAVPGWVSFVMPFGFSFKAIVFNIYQFAGRMMWWITVPALLGALMVMLHWQKGHRREKGFLLFTGIVGLFLVVVLYGNWMTYDTPGSLVPTVGNAHLRYWLPLFVLCVVWAAYAVDAFSRLFLARVRFVVPVAVVVASVAFSWCVVWKGLDGLPAVRANLFQGAALQHEVARLTEPDALIIVDREDKFIFSERTVTRAWNFEELRTLLVEGTPVYYLDVNNDVYFKELFERVKAGGMRVEKQAEWTPHVLFKVFLSPLE